MYIETRHPSRTNHHTNHQVVLWLGNHRGSRSWHHRCGMRRHSECFLFSKDLGEFNGHWKFYGLILFTLWSTNIAMENGHL